MSGHIIGLVVPCTSPGPALDEATRRAQTARGDQRTIPTIWQTAIGQSLAMELADLSPEYYTALEEDVRLHGVRGSHRYVELKAALVAWLDRCTVGSLVVCPADNCEIDSCQHRKPHARSDGCLAQDGPCFGNVCEERAR